MRDTLSTPLPPGTRIRFLHDIHQDATGDTPRFIFARRGDCGFVEQHAQSSVGAGKKYYTVFWDNWLSASFYASADEFEVIK